MTGKIHDKIITEMERDPDYIRKIETLALFAGSIAHDYNNALTVVLGNLSLAKLEARGNNELLDILKDADSAAGRIKKLTERLAAFSGGLKTEKSRFSLKELVDSSAGKLVTPFNCTFDIGVKDGAVMIEGDREFIELALQNVLVNAFEAVSPDSGVISVKAGKIKIDENLFFKETELNSGTYALIKIEDNGPGLENGEINYIFDPYYTTKPQHHGLGLAMSYAIIKKQRGFIKAESETGKGTIISIYLPIV
jgi:signal transduction histidine kinase